MPHSLNFSRLKTMFYVKLALAVIWFMFCSVLTLVIALVRWRHPSNGYIFTRLFTKPVHWLIGMKVLIKNEDRLRANQPCIFIGNHQSNFDILTHGCCYPPRTVAIGKKELIWIPFFGILFLACGNIMLNRKNHEEAVRNLKTAEDDIVKKNMSVYIFPEGTRSRDAKHLLPFKKGPFHMAVNAQVPLVPIVATSVEPLIDMKRRKFHAGTINIEVLEPISTKGLTENNIDELISRAQTEMQAALDRISTTLD